MTGPTWNQHPPEVNRVIDAYLAGEIKNLTEAARRAGLSRDKFRKLAAHRPRHVTKKTRAEAAKAAFEAAIKGGS